MPEGKTFVEKHLTILRDLRLERKAIDVCHSDDPINLSLMIISLQRPCCGSGSTACPS